MRSLFGLLFVVSLVTGCTRANPDAFTLPEQDLATPPLTGTGGGSGGGGGGTAGGGGSSSVVDLAIAAHDLAVLPPDLADPLAGVRCGTTSCTVASKDSCCISASGESCIGANMSCGNGGVTFSCDGPEDCTNGDACCGSATATTSGKGATCGSAVNPACVPLCHTLADCGQFTGYLACCPVANTPYDRCSRTACK
jgi:hypothetical protein